MKLQDIILFILIAIIFLGINPFGWRICHFLNNLFNLPHPGPNDKQGPCECRRNESKSINDWEI